MGRKMRKSYILNIDNRGRIVIPNVVRRSLGIEDANQILMIADDEKKEAEIHPVAWSGEKETIKLKIYMDDVAGALAKIATTFGEEGISLIHGEASVVEKGKSAIWTVIAPVPEDMSVEELIKVLLEKGKAKKVEILES